jgi:RsiW-degrading membrane proteinase PrsW (M82 family)
MNNVLEILRLLYVAMGPGIAIAVFIYYSDKWDRKPKILAIKCFFFGGLAVFPSYYYEGVAAKILGIEVLSWENPSFFWTKTLIYAFFGVSLAEELCKFLFLKAFVFNEKEFNEPFDGIIYGGLVGCGFATVENILYVVPQGQEVGIIRMITAVPGHAFLGIILGYFLGRAKFSVNGVKYQLFGLIVVIFLHGIYDTAAFSNTSWSFYLIFSIILLSIYLGLKAKRQMEKMGTVIEFSPQQYLSLKSQRKRVFLYLRDIRCLLSKGELVPEDILRDKKSGDINSVQEIFSSKIVSQYKSLPKVPFCGMPIKLFLLFYQMTFGFYLYFWFLRNYRDLASYKTLKINPELLALGLFILTVLPYYFYGAVLNYYRIDKVSFMIDISFNLLVAGIESLFLYFQFHMFLKFFKKKLANSFSVSIVIVMFFILSGLKKTLSPTINYYLFIEMILIFFQGLVLAFVQRDLNRYWKHENERSNSSYCV